MADITKKNLKVSWTEVLNQGFPATQEQIRALQVDAKDKLRQIKELLMLVEQEVMLIERMCDHPNFTGHSCPDCGWDDQLI